MGRKLSLAYIWWQLSREPFVKFAEKGENLYKEQGEHGYLIDIRSALVEQLVFFPSKYRPVHLPQVSPLVNHSVNKPVWTWSSMHCSTEPQHSHDKIDLLWWQWLNGTMKLVETRYFHRCSCFEVHTACPPPDSVLLQRTHLSLKHSPQVAAALTLPAEERILQSALSSSSSSSFFVYPKDDLSFSLGSWPCTSFKGLKCCPLASSMGRGR